MSSAMMRVLKVVPAGTTHPFGDERTVTQAFPAGIDSSASDPFLMCDSWDSPSDGEASDPDDYPVDWHPHRGQLVITYLKSGVGRHADSLGNRETFPTPGLQWISAGSGVMHAEGGGTPRGEPNRGFQIWVNLPTASKMDDPAYGTEPPEAIPPFDVGEGGARARLLAGERRDRVGPIRAQVEVQMMDFEVPPGGTAAHDVPPGMDTCMLYVYEGVATVGGQREVKAGHVALLDAGDDGARRLELSAGGEDGAPAMALLFVGKKLREPIAWHGPIVMNTQAQIRQCLQEIRGGNFPPVRVPWNYRRIGEKPVS